MESRQAAKARRTIEAAINNPNVPEARKQAFRERLAEFEAGVPWRRELERVEAIGNVPQPGA